MTEDGKTPKAGAHIAGEDEVLECLTSVLRGDEGEDERITPRDRLRAAELLAKRYGVLRQRRRARRSAAHYRRYSQTTGEGRLI